MNNESKEAIHITDHALVRYLERIKGVDMKAVKEEMLSINGVEKSIHLFKSLKIPIAPKLFFIVKDKHIVTVLHEEDRKSFFQRPRNDKYRK